MLRRSMPELALTDCRNLDMSESRHIAVQHAEISTVLRKCDSVAETQHGAPQHVPVCCGAADPLGGRVMHAASSPLLALPPTKKYPPTVPNPRPESESANGEERTHCDGARLPSRAARPLCRSAGVADTTGHAPVGGRAAGAVALSFGSMLRDGGVSSDTQAETKNRTVCHSGFG